MTPPSQFHLYMTQPIRVPISDPPYPHLSIHIQFLQKNPQNQNPRNQKS
ncbi:hypothetical protein HanXRQr2_Chr05g0199761 [Helianthus annuus]|uniref:Uncharacterized protein n=1 Tax=Helianthus annuus TaxID=4232 RepID=A0A9K3NLE6_HELAN|nr:hypothetical protein HanXRQr2_Chr05g0199761 [Helianthus annuus]KAJ0921524.1 hypothetical protein HanPSC8_Chr05g0192561 [Helianthus annuus]